MITYERDGVTVRECLRDREGPMLWNSKAKARDGVRGAGALRRLSEAKGIEILPVTVSFDEP